MLICIKKEFDILVETDYGDRCPMLEKKCNLSDTKKLIDDLKNELKIKELKKEVEDLKNKLFKETQLNNTLLIDNQKMKEQIDELQKQNNELMDKIELLEDTPVECSTCGTYSHYVKADAENKKLEQENKRLYLKIKELQEKYDQVLEFNDNLHEGNGELYKQNEKLMKDIKDLKEENETLSMQYCDCESKIKALKNKIDMLNSNCQAERDAHEAIVNSYKERIDDVFFAGKASAYVNARKIVNQVFVKDPIYDEKRKTKYSKEEVQQLMSQTINDYQTTLLAYLNKKKDVLDNKIGVSEYDFYSGCWTWNDFYEKFVERFKSGKI